jgi:hypothetical protein
MHVIDCMSHEHDAHSPLLEHASPYPKAPGKQDVLLLPPVPLPPVPAESMHSQGPVVVAMVPHSAAHWASRHVAAAELTELRAPQFPGSAQRSSVFPAYLHPIQHRQFESFRHD